jgi:hypothetical protein
MSVIAYGTTQVTPHEAEMSPTEVIEHVNEILGYDILETSAVEGDADLYQRAVARIGTTGTTVPAEEVLGPLDSEE